MRLLCLLCLLYTSCSFAGVAACQHVLRLLGGGDGAAPPTTRARHWELSAPVKWRCELAMYVYPPLTFRSSSLVSESYRFFLCGL